MLIIEKYPTTLWFIYECPLKTTRALQFAWCHSNCKDVIKGLHYLLVNKNAVRIYWWKEWPRSTCFLLGTDLHQSTSEPIGTYWNLLEPIGTYWNLLELIRTQQNHFKLIRTSLNLSEPLWTYLNLSQPIQNYQKLSELIQTYLILSKPIWTSPNFSQRNQTYTNLSTWTCLYISFICSSFSGVSRILTNQM